MCIPYSLKLWAPQMINLLLDSFNFRPKHETIYMGRVDQMLRGLNMYIWKWGSKMTDIFLTSSSRIHLQTHNQHHQSTKQQTHIYHFSFCHDSYSPYSYLYIYSIFYYSSVIRLAHKYNCSNESKNNTKMYLLLSVWYIMTRCRYVQWKTKEKVWLHL